MRRKNRLRRLLISLVLAGLVPACGGNSVKQNLTDDFSELAAAGDVDEKADAFSGRMGTPGRINFGETKTIRYHNPPRYRAVKVTASAGDTLDAWVRSDDGDAVAWITNSAMTILAVNDDADETTSDAHVVATATRAGTYYVIMREYALDDATFRVTLASRDLTCGGFTGKQCPAGLACIDDPNDDCDPLRGGADCPGVCKQCVQNVLCVQGYTFNRTLCQCLKADDCRNTGCRSGSHCGICWDPTKWVCIPDGAVC
jgi:hypothetical protein